MFAFHARRGSFVLLEVMPTLSVLAALAMIVILALNPQKRFEEARNIKRRTDIFFLADAIALHARDVGMHLLLGVPLEPNAPQEICAATRTGSCANLVNLSSLIPIYLTEIPMDPLSEDPDLENEHSRYFIQRKTGNRFSISAPDTEGETPLEVTE